MHAQSQISNNSIANNLKRSTTNESQTQPIQRVIRQNGEPIRDQRIRLLSAIQGWDENVAEEIIRRNTDQVDVTWRQVVHRVNEEIMMANIRRRDQELEELRQQRQGSRPSSSGSSASMGALLADQSMPLLPPEQVMGLASGPLAVAGRSTAAMGAVAAGSVFRPIFRPSMGTSADAQVWKSGKKSGPDDIRRGQQPNHPNSYHAEEKVVKSGAFRQGILNVLRTNRHTDHIIDIWILINRSSCHGCTGSLLEAQEEVRQMALRIGVPVARLRFNLSVLGLYTGGDDADRRNLIGAGWHIHIHRGADGQLTQSGYKQVGRGMGDNDAK